MNVVGRIYRRSQQPVCILLHTETDPTAVEWKAHENVLLQYKAEDENGFANLQMLVVSDGGAPSVTQRRSVYERVLTQGPIRVAVVTNAVSHPIKRALTTALTWFNPNIKAFIPEDFVPALEYLGLRGHLEPIYNQLSEMQTLLATQSQTLDRITATLRHQHLVF